MRLSQVAAAIDGKLIGRDFIVQGVCSLDNPKPYCIGFVNDESSNCKVDSQSRELALIVGSGYASSFQGSRILVKTEPRAAFARAMYLLYPQTEHLEVHSTAVVHPSAVIGNRCSVGSYSIIEEDVVIGDGVHLGHHVVLGRKTRIGNSFSVGSNTVIGTSGFGFVADDVTQGRHIRIPHIGGVRIESNVEIGSCVVIARGTIDDTVIGPYVKIDDHVFVAHNVSIGENSIIIAGTEISGSVVIEDNCWIAPQVTVSNGVTVGAGSLVGIGTVVTRDVPGGMVVVGNPARVLRSRAIEE